MDDEEAQPLSGVLITISGGAFRSNNLTDTNGSLILTKLVRTLMAISLFALNFYDTFCFTGTSSILLQSCDERI